MYSAWFESFQIICNAVLRCREDVTATENRVVEDLKKNWSKMVHRVSCGSSRCLVRSTNNPRFGQSQCSPSIRTRRVRLSVQC